MWSPSRNMLQTPIMTCLHRFTSDTVVDYPTSCPSLFDCLTLSRTMQRVWLYIMAWNCFFLWNECTWWLNPLDVLDSVPDIRSKLPAPAFSSLAPLRRVWWDSWLGSGLLTEWQVISITHYLVSVSWCGFVIICIVRWQVEGCRVLVWVSVHVCVWVIDNIVIKLQVLLFLHVLILSVCECVWEWTWNCIRLCPGLAAHTYIHNNECSHYQSVGSYTCTCMYIIMCNILCVCVLYVSPLMLLISSLY